MIALKIQWNLLNVYRMLGRNEEALAAGEASLRLARAQNLREQIAYAANDLIYVYMALGNNKRTLEMEELATELWRELDNQPMLTDSLVNLASTKALMGAFDEALAIGATGQAQPLAQQAYEVAKAHIPLFAPLAIRSQIMVALAENDLKDAETRAGNLQVDGVKLDSMNYFVPEFAVGHLAIAQGRFAFADKLSQAVMALLTEQGLLSYLPEFAYLRGLALVKLGHQARGAASGVSITPRSLRHPRFCAGTHS